MSARLQYGLTKTNTRKLAYQFAVSNGKNVKEWDKSEEAGKEWMRGFFSRNNTLSLRKPEPTSMSQATSFNRFNVSAFFNNLINCLSRSHFTPDRIYNLDETGNSTVHVPPKIIATKGSKQVGCMTTGEWGINVTMICAINAAGNHVPPMIIFPRKKCTEPMLLQVPPGTIGGANPSGWSNDLIFVQYLQHFIKHAKPSVENKILLIMDNHESHITVEAIKLARENHIIFLTLPPHTSHKLQPLDRTVFGPYKTFYNQAVKEWMVENRRPISIYNIGGCISKAYGRAFSVQNIIKGFQVTGIFPLNEGIFGDDEFLPSYVTDRPIYNSNITDNTTQGVIQTEPQSGPSNSLMTIEKESRPGPSNSLMTIETKSQTGPSNESDETRPLPTQITPRHNLGIVKSIVSPEDTRPFPKAPERKLNVTQKGRKKGRTRILTHSRKK